MILNGGVKLWKWLLRAYIGFHKGIQDIIFPIVIDKKGTSLGDLCIVNNKMIYVKIKSKQKRKEKEGIIFRSHTE